MEVFSTKRVHAQPYSSDFSTCYIQVFSDCFWTGSVARIVKFRSTPSSAPYTRRVLPDSRTVSPRCAVRIRSANSREITIAKTRYVPEVMVHKCVLRGRSKPKRRLPRPPVDRITSNRCRKPRTDVLQIRDQNFRNLIFIIPQNFWKKVILCPKRVFLTFRGTSGPQGGPTGTWECSHSIRH